MKNDKINDLLTIESDENDSADYPQLLTIKPSYIFDKFNGFNLAIAEKYKEGEYIQLTDTEGRQVYNYFKQFYGNRTNQDYYLHSLPIHEVIEQVSIAFLKWVSDNYERYSNDSNDGFLLKGQSKTAFVTYFDYRDLYNLWLTQALQ